MSSEDKDSPRKISKEVQEELAKKYSYLCILDRSYQYIESFTMYFMGVIICSENTETSQLYLMNCFREHIEKIKADKTLPIKTGGLVYNTLSILQVYKLPKKRPIIERSILGDMFANSVIAQIGDLKFLITGGGPHSSATNLAKLFNLQKNNIEDTKPMLVARQLHSLGIIFTYNTFVYAVGGKNEKGFLSSCEVYDVLNNKWRRTASLNKAKTTYCVYAHENHFLYSFGGVGLNTTNYTVTTYKIIERLDVMEEESGWENIILDANEIANYIFWDRQFALTATAFKPLNPNEIIVFRSHDLVWNTRYSTLRSQEMLGFNSKIGSPILTAKGYLYFTYGNKSLKSAYSYYTKRYMKIN